MFKRNLKRFVAVMMTAAMVIGSSAMAFGGEGSLGGNEGEFEGWVNKKVFSVLVPTADANAFKMIIDPQGLIKETNAAAKEGLSANDFEAGATVLFPRSEPTQPKYGKESDSVSMANVGTVSVNYAITAAVTGLDGKIDLSASQNMAGIEDKAMLFVEMKKGVLPAGTFATENGARWDAAKAGGSTADDAIVLSSNKAVEVSANWIQAVKDEYKVSYNGTEYTYGISQNGVAAAKAAAYGDPFKFSFVGETNDGDLKAWKEAIGVKPVLTITYNITTLDADADEQDISESTDEQDIPESTVEAYANVQDFGGSTGYVLLTKPSESSTFEGLTSASQITGYKLKYNNGSYVDVIDKVMVYNGMVGITYVNAKAALGFDSLSAGDKITIQVVYDDTTYEAVYTQQ